MSDGDFLAQQFEENRGHLRGVAYRMLGSLNEAEDAVQECWIRLSRSESEGIENLRGWLTTVVARVCLDMLRSRKSRHEEPLEVASEPVSRQRRTPDPEAEAVLADSVGYATLVVLDRLNPAERIAFVLHDLFDIPFDEIAQITGRSSEAVRQLASRARRRIRGVTALNEDDLVQQRSLVERFLAGLRLGDPKKLLEVLDPSFAVHPDAVAAPAGAPSDSVTAEVWARRAVESARGARLARLAIVDGSVGLIVAPRGKLFRVLRFTFSNGYIAAMEVIGDPARLIEIEVGELNA